LATCGQAAWPLAGGFAAEFGGVRATGLIPLTKDFESRSKGN
jgi:hypothetical protein